MTRRTITAAGIWLVALGMGLTGVWQYEQFARMPMATPSQGTVYTLLPGTGLADLSAGLAGSGLISNPWYFRLLVYLEGDPRRLRAGEYAISAQTTPRDFLRQVQEGRVVRHALTLIEGWTFRQVIGTLRQDDRLTRTLTGLSDEAVMERLGYPGLHPEGRFFPDTYYFVRGVSDISLLQRAYERMLQVLDGEWSARSSDVPLEQPYEALILASIIEKETAVAAERAKIAGVFIRRLEKGMLLQTDPTVIYGLGTAFDGNLRRRDLEQDSPYNTYMRPGLPPTPIAMPGRASIHAALHPESGTALYFVARGNGEHVFSASLPEHIDAVRRYQLKQ